MNSIIHRTVTVERTPRFFQICGKFDLPNDDTTVVEWDLDVQLPDEWSVGVIVGKSMAGKTTIARELFGQDSVVDQGYWQWPLGKSGKPVCIADGFPAGMSIDEITGLLSSVGFSSPPDWKKPHGSLSKGGQFRVDLARTLAERPELAVVDEFGSLVHQTARQVAAAAAAKAVRRRGGKLVALCVHPDALEYFEPDWVINMVPGEVVRCVATRGSLRRPDIELEIERVDRKAWAHFKAHHYLSADIKSEARCFVAFIGGQPAAFCAATHKPTTAGKIYAEHRTVCLPDYQGVGIGNTLSEFVASMFKATGLKYFSATSHPAFIKHRARSPLWHMHRKPNIVSARGKSGHKTFEASESTGRITAGFQYIGPARPEEAAKFGVLK